MDHEMETIVSGGLRYVHCSCGWRTDWLGGMAKIYAAQAEHERDVKYNLLNGGTTPSVKTLIRQYREKAAMSTYTVYQRGEWTVLADELEERLKAKTDVLPDQMDLFE